MSNDKRNTLIMSALLVLAATLTFLLVDVTVLFVIAYIFALLGIAALSALSFMMLDRRDEYPWISALPHTALSYIAFNVIFSTIVVLIEQLGIWSMPLIPFIFIHGILIIPFAVRAFQLIGGAERITAIDKKVKSKVFFIKSLQADIEMLSHKTQLPELKSKLDKLAEEVRYSDPMSNDALSGIETQITLKSAVLASAVDEANSAGDATAALKAIDEVSLLLKERNKRCLILR